jgi:tRNA A37 methylthiotransferase MiaB
MKNKKGFEKYRVSFVQPNFKQGPGGIAAYLPYSCGLLWSYASTIEIINNSFEVDKFVYKRENTDELVRSLSDNNIVAFSTYVWNRNYNFTLAKKLKENNPNILIVFGGPEPPITNPNIFREVMPFADIVVKNEGEMVFSKILEHFILNKKYEDISGILLNKDGKVINTGLATRIDDLDIIPSPYLAGVFDKIIPLEKEWNGTLETNRGCPYKCTFCDWGSLTYSKIKKFDIDRVFSEIEWMGKHSIGYLDVADANFGIFVDRDNDIVDKLIDVQQKYGFPYRTGWSWAKNQKSEVVSIAKKLIKSGHFNNGLTISLQSLSDDTLSVIKRNNLEINKIVDIFDECKKEGVPLNVELIVGLPGETLKSWEDTLYGVFEIGQHDSIEVWQAQILENAEMNLSQRKEYQLIGRKVLDYFPNSIDDEAPEFSEIVVQTSTMSLEEMVEAYKLSWFLITWHTGGFSQYIARFIRKYCNIFYKDFYKDFRKFLQEDEFWKSEEDLMTSVMLDWYSEGKQIVTELGPVIVSAPTNQYRTIFKIHLDNLYEHMYLLINKYIKKYNLPSDLYNDLITLNKSVVTKQNNIKNFQINLNYNITNYLVYPNSEILNKKEIVEITYPHDPVRSKDIAWFLESIFYARRRSFGKNYIKVIDEKA